MVIMQKSRRIQLGFQERQKSAELAGGQICLVNSTKFHKSCCYIDMRPYLAIFSVLFFRI